MKKQRIWIDLDNTPHVPFFKPIIRELEARGFEVVITARDAFQVCELAQQAGIPHKTIGKHNGKNRVMKGAGLLLRSAQLLPFVLRTRPVLGLSHGSRSQIILCNAMGIPSVMINDYEHADTPAVMRPKWEIVPEILRDEKLHCKEKARIRFYKGIKEDVYAPEFEPNPAIQNSLGLDGKIVVTVRPPATEAHYHNPESEVFFEDFMERVVKEEDVMAVLLPRNKKQEKALRDGWPKWFGDGKVVVPEQAVDGLNLLWYSDLVVSGGGTMNREAAALGVPVYSIFRGRIGAVDRQLEEQGRLTLIASREQIRSRINLTRRAREREPETQRVNSALVDIVRHVQEIVQNEANSRMPRN